MSGSDASSTSRRRQKLTTTIGQDYCKNRLLSGFLKNWIPHRNHDDFGLRNAVDNGDQDNCLIIYLFA